MKRWVKLYEDVLDWEWSDDANMMALWSRLLVMASYKDREYRSIAIKRGQVLTSMRSLASESGLSMRTLRTCLARLEESQQVTLETTHRHTIITISNYEKYQGAVIESDTLSDTLSDTPATHQRHTENSLYYDRKKESNNILCENNAHMRTHEEAFDEFFKGQIYVENLCMQEGIGIDTCKALAREILNDWALTGESHESVQDARNHLLNLLRIKINIYKQSNGRKNNSASQGESKANPLSRARSYTTKLGAKHED